MGIVHRVKKLKLPTDQYVVFGSGILDALCIRESRDVDLFVSKRLYQELKAWGWNEVVWETGGNHLVYEDYEADDSWNYDSYNPEFDALRDVATVIDGVPFAPLGEVLKWKRAFGREKDLVDINLIETFLNQPGTRLDTKKS